MKRLWRLLGWCAALALVVYFVVVAMRTLDLNRVLAVISSPVVVVTVVAAAIMYALIVPISAWAWQGLLHAQNEAWEVATLAKILGVSQLAKYVPGNVMQHLARAAGSMRRGMKIRSLFATVAQETVLAVTSSLLIGALALAASGRNLAGLHPERVGNIAMIGALLAAAVLVISCWRVDPDSLEHRKGLVWRVFSRVGGTPGPKVSLSAFAAYSVNYLIIGAGLWLVAHSLELTDTLGYWIITAAFSLSWVLGFLTPGAPAGLGAREGVMLLLMHGYASEEALVTFVLLARVVTIAGDLLCFAVAISVARLRCTIGGQ